MQQQTLEAQRKKELAWQCFCLPRLAQAVAKQSSRWPSACSAAFRHFQQSRAAILSNTLKIQSLTNASLVLQGNHPEVCPVPYNPMCQ